MLWGCDDGMDKLQGKKIMVWTLMGNARMYEALRDYGDRICNYLSGYF